MFVMKHILLIALLIVPAGLLAADDPLMGTWQMNASQSQMGARPPKSVTRKHEPVPNGVKVTRTGLEADGKPIKSDWTAKFDGGEYPLNDSKGQVITMKRLNPYAVEGTMSHDGKVTNNIRWEVSKDGRTMTITEKHVSPLETTVMVLEKQ